MFVTPEYAAKIPLVIVMLVVQMFIMFFSYRARKEMTEQNFKQS